jgi:hypothetical protein
MAGIPGIDVGTRRICGKIVNFYATMGTYVMKSSAGPKTRFRQKLVVKMTVGLKLLGFSRTSFELIFGCSCDLIRDSNRKLKELSFGPFQSQNGHTFDEM